jgi:hypothetical protein
MLMTEEWRVIPSCPNYAASSLGRIRRIVKGKGTRHSTNDGYLKPMRMKSGYLMVYPYSNGKRETVCVHVLVAEAFIGPCPLGHETHHKDLTKDNNAPENLEYKTICDHRSHKGNDNPTSKLSEEDVINIRKLCMTMTQREVSKIYNVCYATIGHVMSKRNWRHI